MLAVLKWIVLLPFQFLSTFAAWVVSPLAPLFARDFSLRGTWLWWATTPQTDLRGDPDHQARWHYSNSYWQQVTWVLRNPAVNFQRNTLGVSVGPLDTIETIGDESAKDYGGAYIQLIRSADSHAITAWMLYAILPYKWPKGKAFRALLGWKTWDARVKDPLQFTARITPYKSFTPKEK